MIIRQIIWYLRNPNLDIHILSPILNTFYILQTYIFIYIYLCARVRVHARMCVWMWDALKTLRLELYRQRKSWISNDLQILFKIFPWYLKHSYSCEFSICQRTSLDMVGSDVADVFLLIASCPQILSLRQIFRFGKKENLHEAKYVEYRSCTCPILYFKGILSKSTETGFMI